MPLRNPARGIWVVLTHDGPMTTAGLALRVAETRDVIGDLEQRGIVERHRGGWRAGQEPPVKV